MPKSREAVADYKTPAAIIVPYFKGTYINLFQELAREISIDCGVILLTNDKEYALEFIESLDNKEYFHIITATFDTPWIRDRMPFAVKTEKSIEWFLPEVEDMQRPNDDKLFLNIINKDFKRLPIRPLSLGNLIIGANGLAFATNDIFSSGLSKEDLKVKSKELGISDWILFDSFKNEMTSHADLYIRVLSSNLIAVSWNLSSSSDRKVTKELIKKIKKNYNSKIDVIKIPIRSYKKEYASLLNWIQIGSKLIIPKYRLTREIDIKHTTRVLSEYGFRVKYLDSPTLKEGGSLHCLSATVFV